MSGYNPPRRGPNVSQYIQNLNAIPMDNDSTQTEEFGLGDDLDKWASSEFLNFDVVDGLEFAPSQDDEIKPDSSNVEVEAGRTGDFIFTDEYAINNTTFIANNDTLEQANLPKPFSTVPPYDMDFTATQPALDTYSYPRHNVGSVAHHGEKDPLPMMDQSLDSSNSPDPSLNGITDVVARAAAEEDKRRRNTAASARFRVKKKQREQALEKQAKEMTDRVEHLGQRIQQLERENKWLRSLVVEKTGKDENAVDGMWNKFESEEAKGERKPENWKKGVGTNLENSQ